MQFLKTDFLDVPHGFSTRLGGASEGIYESFNLGLSTGDERDVVMANRQKVFDTFAVSETQACVLEQVHSARVVSAKAEWYQEEADASVTTEPNLLLVINTADCLPILFHDPVNQVIAAAHAGWRGTLAGISRNVIEKMKVDYDSSPTNIKAVIGPSIQGKCYQVSQEVIDEVIDARFPDSVYIPDDEGRYRLDLAAANIHLLEQAGVKKIHDLGFCTHCDKEQFYSHRRDGLKRGSHWSVIKLAG